MTVQGGGAGIAADDELSERKATFEESHSNLD